MLPPFIGLWRPLDALVGEKRVPPGLLTLLPCLCELWKAVARFCALLAGEDEEGRVEGLGLLGLGGDGLPLWLRDRED